MCVACVCVDCGVFVCFVCLFNLGFVYLMCVWFTCGLCLMSLCVCVLWCVNACLCVVCVFAV